jgi:hypothetical protein
VRGMNRNKAADRKGKRILDDEYTNHQND